MEVSDSLKKMVAYNPSKQTFQMSALNLCEKIEANDITLPLYQRDISWSLKKCVNLLNYELNGKAPISPISVNKITDISNSVKQINLIDRTIVEIYKEGQLSVTDGQQRLLTNYKCYINDGEFENIVLDIQKGCFIINKSAINIKPYQIPVGILLNKNVDTFFNYINKCEALNSPEIINILLQTRSKLRDYNYTINIAENLSIKEQIEWFEVLNVSGTRITKIQMQKLLKSYKEVKK